MGKYKGLRKFMWEGHEWDPQNGGRLPEASFSL